MTKGRKEEIRRDLARKFSSEEVLDILIRHLKAEHSFSSEKVQDILKKEILIPLGIFERKISALETIVKYLKEEVGLRNKEIADLLNRKETTVWMTYKNAIKKKKESFGKIESEINIPAEIFSDRKLSVLEAIVVYLLEKGMRFNEIAGALHRSESTIRTVYNRSKKK